MINIIDKKNCVGCNACVQKCPKKCIAMHEDYQGFLYPKVDLSSCIDCSLCEKVCPVINQGEARFPVATYSATYKNVEVLKNSSSGGAFFAMGQQVIEKGGVVFGARFNEKWEVVHDYSETIEGIRAFMGSKYVQSSIGDTYRQAEQFLKAGRKVMYTGTPCQLKGLQLFLRKDYGPQLLKVDVICHGVPSPRVWREYIQWVTGLQEFSNKKISTPVADGMSHITDISFRDKRLGWEKFGFRIQKFNLSDKQNSVFGSIQQTDSTDNKTEFYEPFTENLYMRIFLKNLDLRPSCYACPAKCGKSMSTMTIGDFWGVHKNQPQVYDKDGVSAIVDYKNACKDSLCLDPKIELNSANYPNILANNPSLEHSVAIPKYYDKFWETFIKEGVLATETVLAKIKFPIKQQIISLISPFLPSSMKQLIKKIVK